jgi:hypothetical protein
VKRISFFSFLDSKVTVENGSEIRLIENGEVPCFFLLLVNSWTEYGVHAFQQKQSDELPQWFLTDDPHCSVSSYLLFVPCL